MPQYSLTGNILDAAVPGQYYDEADMRRRSIAAPLSSLIDQNPNFRRRQGQENPSAAYLSSGLSYDNEGLLRAYAMKFGQDKAMQLMQALPTMSRQELLNAQMAVQGAANESDSQDQRERQTYERAGMKYLDGQYRPMSDLLDPRRD